MLTLPPDDEPSQNWTSFGNRKQENLTHTRFVEFGPAWPDKSEGATLKRAIIFVGSQLLRVYDVVPYVGFLVVAFLVFQGYQTEQVLARTLRETIEQQNALRNTLWVNLLTQRAMVLTMTPLVTHDLNGFEQSERISGALHTFLTAGGNQSNTSLEEKAQPIFERIRLIGEKARTGVPSARLISDSKVLEDVQELGIELNSEESEKWFDLVAKNNRLLSDLEVRRREANIGYIVFAAYIVFLQWISRRKKRAEADLRQSERKSRLLSEASFEAIVVLDGTSIVEVNPAFEIMFEVQARDAFGRHLEDFIRFPESVPEQERLNQFRLFNEELWAERRYSGAIPIEIAVKEMSVNNRATKVVAIRDLSERKKMADLRLETETAVKANQAKSMFLANMSHELRTPMHGILSYARFGQTKIETASKEKLKNYFDEIYASGSGLMDLLNDLLDLSKLESGKTSYSMLVTDFNDTVATTVSSFEAFAFERQLKIKVESPVDGIMISMDPERIMQVLRNLISNALKFSNPGSEVHVQVESLEGGLRCSVANQGVGIPEDELEMVFDKFVQSSKTRTGAGGTGLGLAICREIINHHGGKIWAESQSDGLTTFTFEIPNNVTTSQEAA